MANVARKIAALGHQAMGRVRRIHLIGIGGVGMCGIAEVLLNQGYVVSGSDLVDSATVRRLRSLGAVVHCGHDADYISGADVVVRSSAISDDNPELSAAHARRVPVVPRAQMLAELMRFRYSVAVAGTHGKTSTTSLIAAVLAAGGLDPTFVIGGVLNSLGSAARLGGGDYLVAEADESDISFLHLLPMLAVITNIEPEHMDNYGGDFAKVRSSYLEFIHNLPFYGLVVLCADDLVLSELRPQIARPQLSYGFAADADFRIVDFQVDGVGSRFSLRRPEGKPLSLSVPLPGRHNAQNVAAAVAVGSAEGLDDGMLRSGVESFQGVHRRFQVRGDFSVTGGEVCLLDDYGHHPTEVAVTIEAIREIWPQRRLLMIYQPHRYSRTRDLYEDFVAVLSQVDVLVLMEVYAAGEEPYPGIDGRGLCGSLRNRGRIDPVFAPDCAAVLHVLPDLLRPDDIVLTQGAGNVGELSVELATQLGAGGMA